MLLNYGPRNNIDENIIQNVINVRLGNVWNVPYKMEETYLLDNIITYKHQW